MKFAVAMDSGTFVGGFGLVFSVTFSFFTENIINFQFFFSKMAKFIKIYKKNNYF